MFGENFHIGYTLFTDLRPFYIKNATRTTCMCIYHLRWREMSVGLHNYRKALKQNKISVCACEFPKNESELRKQLICPRLDETKSYDNVSCVMQKCGDCSGAKNLVKGAKSLCEQETHDPGDGMALSIKFENYEKAKCVAIYVYIYIYLSQP